MVPVTLGKAAQDGLNNVKLASLCGPPDVFFESQLLLQI
jgi:hypothetical protein